MILQQKKVKLENEDANNRRNPNSTLGIYLTAARVAQFIHVAANTREMDEAKKITAKKTATRNIHLQLKISEAFDMFINSMNSLSLSNTDEDRFIHLIQQSPNTIKGAFVHIGGKLAELHNHRRNTVYREMIQIMK